MLRIWEQNDLAYIVVVKHGMKLFQFSLCDVATVQRLSLADEISWGALTILPQNPSTVHAKHSIISMGRMAALRHSNTWQPC